MKNVPLAFILLFGVCDGIWLAQNIPFAPEFWEAQINW